MGGEERNEFSIHSKAHCEGYLNKTFECFQQNGTMPPSGLQGVLQRHILTELMDKKEKLKQH